MRQLLVKPQIHSIDTFKDFAQEFNLTNEDLIFTEQSIYDTFIKSMNLPCTVICRDPNETAEPSDKMIDCLILKAQKKVYKRVVAVGGGSVIDIAKILTLKNAYPCSRLFLRTVPIVKEKKLIIIPTTCGTGSEVTNISIANISEKNSKIGLVDVALYADYSVLIPELVKGLPFRYFVFSAVDALVHAMESYVSPNASVITEMFSIKAMKMILSGFGKVIRNGPEYRKEIIVDFSLASNIAGIAFSNAGVGPVHALAYPLGGAYHVAHGESNYQFLATVFNKYLQEKPKGKLEDLCGIIGEEINKVGITTNGEDTFVKLEEFLGRLLPLKPLREYGMKESEIELFTQSVIDNQQRLLVNSYIPFAPEIISDVYRQRY